MWKLTIIVILFMVYVNGQKIRPSSGDELVSTVLNNCIDTGCVKQKVLDYLDHILNIQSDSRNAKNIDAAIFKRAARVLNTREFRFKLPEVIFDKTEIVYNPRTGIDIAPLVGNEEGMPMALSMAPAPIEPPATMYGIPGPSTAPPSSYEPGWEPSQGGPYQRIWTTSNNDPQTFAYSAYYPGTATLSSSTSRP